MSYHATILAIVPSITDVSLESTIEENGEETMSVETIGSSVYASSPASGPLSDAALSAALISSALVSRAHSAVRSTTEPVGTGASCRCWPSATPARCPGAISGWMW